MYKKILFILLVVLGMYFLIGTERVEAYSTDVVYSLSEQKDCNSLLGDPKKDGTFANFLQQIFKIMGYAAPLLCLVLSTFDFVKATASQDKDALMKAMKNTGKRIVLAIVLFFLPTLINFLFPLLGWYGTCGIE